MPQRESLSDQQAAWRKTKRSRASTAALLCTAAVIIGLTLVIFGRALSGGQIFAMRDTAHFYYPLFSWCAEEWQAGRLPLWNPYEGIGSPVLADATSSVLYPGKLLFTLPLPFDWMFQFYIVAHFLLATMGTWWLVREQKRSAAAATLAAIAFAFGGSILFQYANVVFLVGAAWLPWAWLFLARLLRNSNWRDAVWLAFVLALLTLGGDPQMVVHVAIIAVIGWLVQPKSPVRGECPRESATREPWRSRLQNFAWKFPATIAAAFVFAGLLAAVQILPSAVFARRTTRAQFEAPRSLYEIPSRPQLAANGILGVTPSGTHHEQVYDFSIGPWRWLELFVPNIAGRPFPRHQRWLNYLPAEGSLWAPSLYMGLLPLLFAFSQLRLKRGNALSRWLTWAAIFFALGSLGWYGLGWLVREIGTSLFGLDTRTWFIGHPVGGVYWLLVTFVPGYVQFRYPAKLWTIVALALACLAARGCDAFLRRKSSALPKWWMRGCLFFLAAAMITPAIFSGFEASFPNPPSDPYWGPFQYQLARRDVGLGFAQVAIVCGLAWQCWKLIRNRSTNQRTSWAAWGLVLLTAADLAMANSWQVITMQADHLHNQVMWTFSSPSRNDPLRIKRQYRLESDRWSPSAFATSSRDNRPVEIIDGELATSFGRFPLLWHQGMLRSYTSLVDAEYAQHIRHIDSLLEGSEAERAKAEHLLDELEATCILVPRERLSKNADGEYEIFAGKKYLRRVSFSTVRAWTTNRSMSIKVLREEGGILDLELPLPAATETKLIVNVAYDPGWQATCVSEQGRTPTKVERSHSVLCSLNIPAGTRQIEMRYDPPEFRWGAAISGIAWSSLMLAFLARTVRRRIFKHRAAAT